MNLGPRKQNRQRSCWRWSWSISGFRLSGNFAVPVNTWMIQHRVHSSVIFATDPMKGTYKKPKYLLKKSWWKLPTVPCNILPPDRIGKLLGTGWKLDFTTRKEEGTKI